MPRVKLTDHDRYLIRELAKEGLSSREIAEKFEVNKSTIERLVSDKIWGKQKNGAKTTPTKSYRYVENKPSFWSPEACISRAMLLRQNYHRRSYPEIGSREGKERDIYL